MATVIKSPTNIEYSKDVIAAPTISGQTTITVSGAIATVNGKIANYLYLPAASLIRKPRANWQYRTLTEEELEQLGGVLEKSFSDRVIVINVPVRGLATDIKNAKNAQTPFEFKLFVFFKSDTPPTNKQVLTKVRKTYQQLNRPTRRRVAQGTFEYVDALVNEKFAMDIAGVNTAKLVNRDAAFVVGYEVAQVGMMLQQYSVEAKWDPKLGDTVIIELISVPRNSLVKPRRIAVQKPLKVTISDTSLAAARTRIFATA